ncbi:MAG: hypothetical protein WDZ62_01340 [Candidatus Pacearchaeota archaeon]
MAKKKSKKVNKNKQKYSCSTCGSCGGGIYFLGFIGSLIYFIQTSTGFWATILGILKAIVWPVFVVYKLLGL